MYLKKGAKLKKKIMTLMVMVPVRQITALNNKQNI